MAILIYVHLASLNADNSMHLIYHIGLTVCAYLNYNKILDFIRQIEF